MDLNYSPEEIAFRDEVRAFLSEKLPPELAAKVRQRGDLTKEDMERWHAILNEKGWLAYGWPVEFGGTGWSPVEKHIFEEECAEYGAPTVRDDRTFAQLIPGHACVLNHYLVGWARGLNSGIDLVITD